ncbi:MAG: cobalamin-dependent protein [Verrucomicrobia bacterium]|nr:cobalamin-dependent protein [Verrucomicrobiota bacterium]
MNVYLVQPPDSPRAVEPVESIEGAEEVFAPPFNLLCLGNYLSKYTRHVCRFIDCRLHSNLEADLTEAFSSLPEPCVLVLNAPNAALGEVVAVLEIAKRHFPSMQTVLCGDHPSHFPQDISQLPSVDYACIGDPEPILQKLLDYIDMPPRLRHIQGLYIKGEDRCETSWLDSLRRLSLPEWGDVFWRAYDTSTSGKHTRAEFRLTRGHTRLPADRAFGGTHEPFRVWPMEQAARAMLHAAIPGIHEVQLTDSPGVWTQERLMQWCNALQRVRNIQPWGLNLLPASLDEETLEAMRIAFCRKVNIVFPSCSPTVLEKYGIILSPRDIAWMIQLLEANRIRVHTEFWIGGPEEKRGEPDRILRMIRRLGNRSFAVRPFPLAFDSPLHRQMSRVQEVPQLTEWVKWARDPWVETRPMLLWGGNESVRRITAQCQRIEKAVRFNPLLKLHVALKSGNLPGWIAALEDAALRMLPFGHKKHN